MTGCAREQYLGSAVIEFSTGFRVLVQGKQQGVDYPWNQSINALPPSFCWHAFVPQVAVDEFRTSDCPSLSSGSPRVIGAFVNPSLALLRFP
jgi:hypothetical protein